MSDDQITDLARLLPPGAAPDLPAERLQILKEHLMVEYRLAAGNRRPTPQRRSARRPLIAALGAGAALAAVAATALVLVLSGGQPAPASPAAVQLLAKVADVAARQPAPAVSNGEFMYVRSEVSYAVYENGSQTRQVRTGQPERGHLPAAAVAPDRPAHAAQPDLHVRPGERRGPGTRQ